MDEIRQILKENLKHYRKRAGLTQQSLAEACGVTTPYIGEIETGRRFVSLQLVETFSKVLGVEPWRLFLPMSLREKPVDDLVVQEIKVSVIRAVADAIDRVYQPKQE